MWQFGTIDFAHMHNINANMRDCCDIFSILDNIVHYVKSKILGGLYVKGLKDLYPVIDGEIYVMRAI